MKARAQTIASVGVGLKGFKEIVELKDLDF